MKNIKDVLSTISAVLIALGGLVYTLSVSGLIIPAWLNTAGLVAAALGGTIVSFLTGKNADGSRKTVLQIKKQKEVIPAEKKETPEYNPTAEQLAAMGTEKKE